MIYSQYEDKETLAALHTCLWKMDCYEMENENQV